MARPARSHKEGGRVERYDVVVIGGGQGRPGPGFYLARQGRRFQILEREHDVASAWRDRWDSLTLFTPRRYDSLPGLAFPGDPAGYPPHGEVGAYLQPYAASFDPPIRLQTEARSLTRRRGAFAIETDSGTIVADQVV